mgnify:CR=1 FL=1
MKKHLPNLSRYSVLLILFFCSIQLFAQKTITGVVTDESNNETLIGVKVSIKDKTISTSTDINGKYSIKVTEKDVLIFSYIGMSKESVTVGTQKEINVAMKGNSTQLQEVVAIGYGTVKKSDLTGAVAVVSAKELTRNPAPSVAQALQGKAPGVLVFQSGAPGGGANIRVRGVGSINSSSNPIYILDGVPVSSISNIQPQDIENIQVLKDASSTAIYGANGSNGVVIINTKRGKSGKIQVNLNTNVGYSLKPKQYDMMNADEYCAFYKELNGDKTEYTQAFREKYYGTGWQQGTNWQDYVFQNGSSQSYNLSFSGGGENSNYNVALGYVKEKGTVIKTSAENYTMRVNSDFKLNSHVKFGETVNINYGMGESPIDTKVQTSVYDLNESPLMKVYNSDLVGGYETCSRPYYFDASGALVQGVNSAYETLYNTSGNDKDNPLTAIELCSNKSNNSSMRANVYMQVDFNKYMWYKITPAVDVQNSRTRKWIPFYEGYRSPGIASLTESYSENIILNIENQLSYNRNFNNTHNLQATVVSQVKRISSNYITGAASGYDFEDLNTLSNGTTRTVDGGNNDYWLISYLGRAMYDYKGKYFVTASVRSDGVSVFGPANKWGRFMAFSGAWKVNEDFLKDVKEIDALKVRFGWGQTGNSNITYYMYYDQITGTNMFSPVFGENQTIASARFSFYQKGNPTIQWESSEMYNLGTDLTMFGGKLQASAEYFIKNIDNLLTQKEISYIFGVKAKPWYNLGSMQNKGIELNAQWRDRIGKFNYGINGNISTVKNVVKSLPSANIIGTYNATLVGHSVGALYGYVCEGVIQLDESNYAKDANGNYQKNASGQYIGYKHATQNGNTPQPGDLKYTDLNGDGSVTALDRTVIGKTIPSFNYTFGFDCSYNDLDFNIFFYGVSDFDIYNYQRASLSGMNAQDMNHNKLAAWGANHWTLENASTKYVRADVANSNLNDRISTFWIENGSFLRVKDIQIGYNTPKKVITKLGLASARIYVSASNIYCFSNYQGRDPESFISSSPLSGGFDSGSYSVPHTFSMGMQIGF